MFRLVDVQLKIVNVFRLGSNGAGVSPDDVSMRRFFVPRADGFESLGNSILVALQLYTYRPVRIVASVAREIIHDRLLLDHRPVTDFLNLFAYYRGHNRLLLSVCRVRQGRGDSTDENRGKQLDNAIGERSHAILLPLEFCAIVQPIGPSKSNSISIGLSSPQFAQVGDPHQNATSQVVPFLLVVISGMNKNLNSKNRT